MVILILISRPFEKDDRLGKGGTQTSQMPAPRPLSRVASGNSIDFDFQVGLEKAGPRYSILLEAL